MVEQERDKPCSRVQETDCHKYQSMKSHTTDTDQCRLRKCTENLSMGDPLRGEVMTAALQMRKVTGVDNTETKQDTEEGVSQLKIQVQGTTKGTTVQRSQ